MEMLTRVDEGETTKMSVNFVQVTGPVSCIRCDYSTAIEHETGAPLEVQQELLMGHLNAIHPDWQLDGFKQAVERGRLKAEHARLKDAVVEAAKGLRQVELYPAADWPIEREREAFRVKVDALIAFEAEHKIGE